MTLPSTEPSATASTDALLDDLPDGARPARTTVADAPERRPPTARAPSSSPARARWTTTSATPSGRPQALFARLCCLP